MIAETEEAVILPGTAEAAGFFLGIYCGRSKSQDADEVGSPGQRSGEMDEGPGAWGLRFDVMIAPYIATYKDNDGLSDRNAMPRSAPRLSWQTRLAQGEWFYLGMTVGELSSSNDPGAVKALYDGARIFAESALSRDWRDEGPAP